MVNSQPPDPTLAERERRRQRTREREMEALRTAASAVYGESQRIERDDDSAKGRRLARRLDRIADGLVRRATRLYLKQQAFAPTTCGCGSTLANLREFFGPALEGHVIRCRACGADDCHVDDGGSECLVCGAYSHVDAEGSVERGNHKTGERHMERDVDAERERYFADQER